MRLTVLGQATAPMIRTFKYPLRPTAHQAHVLTSWLVLCQRLYNAALEQRRYRWTQRRATTTYNQQTAELTQLRAEDPAYAILPVEAARSALRRLDRAFQAFFRRLKNGETPGYPRFRSRDRYDSFSLLPCRVKANRVLIPKLGFMKFRCYRPMRGEVLQVHVRRSAQRWWVSFVCEVGDAPPKRPVQAAVGIDLGLTSFATLSNGDTVENPRYFRAGEAQLARQQQRLARCKRGSATRRRCKILVGRAHEHIQNQRLDFSRKLATALYERFDLVAHEDMNVRGLLQSDLAKSIIDAAWSTFLHCLTLKAENAGAWAVPVDPRGTTQRCSGCGLMVHKTLRDRTHNCLCGLTLGRDHNAAINVLTLALGRSVAESQSSTNQERYPTDAEE